MSDGKNADRQKEYEFCLVLTQQFRHCGNPFRADTYQGCDYGCKYCFATYSVGHNNRKNGIRPAKIKTFENALNGKGSKLTLELLKNKTPIHLGGMSDPFQKAEIKHKRTLEFLKLFNNYPISISTKTASLTDDYWRVLNPKYHTFQISLISDNENTIRLFESNTPTAKDRISFIKELKRRGFWVSVRIQPLIYVNEAISLLNKLEGCIDFATVEHLKITKTGTQEIRKLMFSKLGDEAGLYKVRRNYYKLPYNEMKKNINKIKSSTNIKIGCGDNEFHENSDCLNCCGIDLMPNSFKNWMKYNSQYIQMTGDKDVFIPRQPVTKDTIPSNTFKRFSKNTSYKFYVDKYLEDVYKYEDVNLFSQLPDKAKEGGKF